MISRPKRHEVGRRVRAVRQMLAGGMDHGDIIAFAAQAWGIGRQQVWRYLCRVYRDWQSFVEAESPNLRRLAAEQRIAIFRRALKAREFRAALAALDSRDSILGLYEPRERLGPAMQETLAELIRESLEAGEGRDGSGLDAGDEEAEEEGDLRF